VARKKKKTSAEALNEALQLVSPGRALREGISTILQSGLGSLICIGDTKRLVELSEGGVETNCPYTPQLLYELSKMDGAIILNQECSRILFANRFLKPDSHIPSNETGTRHRAAERIARQVHCVVVAVSERRGSVTLYVDDRRHVLDNIATLLNKATQAIATLEKYINVMNDTMEDLSVREFQDMVTIFEVCRAVQRYEMVVRIAREIEPYMLGLGTEGRLIELQLQELVIPCEEAELVIKDYYKGKSGLNYDQVRAKIAEISPQDLLDLTAISQALGYGPNLHSIDTYLSPRGYRVLTSTHRLTPPIIDKLVDKFGSLQPIIRAPKDELVQVDGVGEILAERVRTSLNLLRSQLAIDKATR
jgi:diadenylate cyclase